MGMTEFIAAIHLGTRNITGVIGRRKTEEGELSVIAYETEPSDGCILRGRVNNTSIRKKVRGIVSRMETKIPGNRIAKVYIGFGGQSLRSVEKVVTRNFGSSTEITDSIMAEIDEEGRIVDINNVSCLDVLSQDCLIDGRPEKNVVGSLGSKVEAHYLQIVMRSEFHKQLLDILSDKLSLADIIISPFAVADALLEDKEKYQGCILIDFGWGVTSVSMYRKNKLEGMRVIPIGCSSIVKDISEECKLSEQEAENDLVDYPCIIIDKEKEKERLNADGDSYVEVSDDPKKLDKPDNLDEVVSARVYEIIENIKACLAELSGGKHPDNIIITGYGRQIARLADAVSKVLGGKASPRHSLKQSVTLSADSVCKDDFMAIGMLLEAERNYINCAAQIQQPQQAQAPQQTNPVVTTPKEEKPQTPQQGKGSGTGKSGSRGLFRELKKTMGGMKDLFDMVDSEADDRVRTDNKTKND
jgi:cell division protein FtsA